MNRNKISIKIGGPAGYGIKSTGIIFSKTCLRSGLNVFDSMEYPSLIRGGHNVYYARAEQGKVLSFRDGIDFLIALTPETMRIHRDEINHNGGILFDPDSCDISKIELRKDIHLYPVQINKIAKGATGTDLARNTVALGAMIEIIGFDLTILVKVISSIFGQKSKKVAELNIAAAEAGYQYARDTFTDKFEHKVHRVTREKDNRILISGNEAIAYGSIASSCMFYSAYPMTPSSTILHTLAEKAQATGMVVKHAEDEISVINMAIGASYAGVRSMCGTSGGGFALMNEAFGLAGITETPLVVAEVQRPGPATGLPTWSGQADLGFVLHSAQGEFPRAILAPGDPKECFEMTSEAFNMAEKFQIPVVILSDKYLGESNLTIREFEVANLTVNRGQLLTQSQLDSIDNFKRYEVTKSGVSNRSTPGMKGGRFLANSDEHDEYGFSAESADNAIAQMDKRMRKEEAILKSTQAPTLRGDENAKITIVSWGSTKGAIVEAMKLLKAKGVSANFLQIKHIWPFHSEEVEKILKSSKKLLLVEGNKTGQLGKLIRQETGVEIKNKLLRYDGRPISPEEIVREVLMHLQ